MTKQEWIDAAKAEGVKLRGAFLDDVWENVAILLVGVVFGWFSHAVYRLFN